MPFLQRAAVLGALLSLCVSACSESEPGPDEPSGSGGGMPDGGAGGFGGHGGEVVEDELPDVRNESFCPIDDFAASCEDGGYYQFELSLGCGLSRYIRMDDSFTYDLTYTDEATGEIVYRAVLPEFGGRCDVYVDETDGAPTCDDWTLQPCSAAPDFPGGAPGTED